MISGLQLQHCARATAASLDDASPGYPFTPHLEVWKVRGRVFLIVTEDDPSLQIVTLKVDPHHGDALRQAFASISPGRYLNKLHWISIGAGAGITKELIEDLVHRSWDLVRESRS